MTTFLDENQLLKKCPSIFATMPAEHTSSRYGFVPTIDVVRGLEKAGFRPVMAAQSKTRLAGKRDHTRHIMRFRHFDTANQRDVIPEIVMVNSHDGSSSYQLRSGIYRMVCTNGLIVGDEYFCRSVKHTGQAVEKVVEAATDLLEIVPISVRKAEEWKGIELKPEHKRVFAGAAKELRFEGEMVNIVKTEHVLAPRRWDDKKDDLWTTFNTLQENIIRGGVSYRTPEGMRNRTREVGSITENVRLNTALWTLTEKMAELLR